MTAAETMAKARWEFIAKRDGYPNYKWEHRDQADKDADIELERVALRAFAEMEPTEKMREAAEETLPWISTLGVRVGKPEDPARAYAFAAAEEIDTPKTQLKPKSQKTE